ncbi:MAG: vWA domain-containing protein [Burkholderiaceae bacterium]
MAIVSLALIGASIAAHARPPLLMPGKKTLYQKVLTRPGAVLSPTPGGSKGTRLGAFSPYFVYERVKFGSDTWLRVGPGIDGKTTGYLPESGTAPWEHAIVLAFTPRTSRDRVLFFRDRAAIEGLMNEGDAPKKVAELRAQITAAPAAGRPKDHPVIAIEPETAVDFTKKFYLLPALKAEEILTKRGPAVRIVQAASVTVDSAPAAVAKPSAASSKPAAKPPANVGIANFNSAVVFVIDATASMQPYIERTRKAMQTVLGEIEKAKLGDRISFGLVAFQDDPAKTKGMEYLAKVFADPAKVKGRQGFTKAIEALKATQSSTRAFAEDAYAGIDVALEKIEWAKFGGRYIVFITDASAREGGSALATTGLTTEAMRLRADEKQVAIYSMHLRTPAGKSDHRKAERQFKQLSAWPGIDALYFPIQAGDPAKFEEGVLGMAKSLVDQVKSPARLIKQALAQPAPVSPVAKPPPKLDPAAEAKARLDAVGRAMVLAYLGRVKGEKAPPFYVAWTSDRDIADPIRATLSVRVLLTKDQLSDMYEVVRRTIEAGEAGQISSTALFEQLRSAAVALSRDPSKIGKGKAKNLAEAGLMGEYLEGLPYRSVLASMPLDDWTNLGVAKSEKILESLRAKLALYKRFHADVDAWVKLNPDGGEGDKVYPVPIDSLP